jgi:RNA polymerase sigma-70 factor (ECF subfamily)
VRTDIEPLFRAHYGRLVRALTLVCGSEEAAADAVQEAFVKAHQKWRTVSQYDDPVGWIRRVAINRLRDQHRSDVRKERAVNRLGAGETWSVEAAEPSSTEMLAAAMADLPKQQRLSLALFYLEGLSVAETAAALEISEGAVKFNLHQGRDRLRTLIGEEGRP